MEVAHQSASEEGIFFLQEGEVQIIRSYLRPSDQDDVVELDFTGVSVVAPSWLDEVYLGIKNELGKKVIFLESTNLSVIESIKIIIE
ncbi:MAG: DUF4325 domain-containing protein [Oligoflexia bacterium]|nr:DUF4325 domain-containing protein [Oligoflexia bacterium]